MAAPGSGLGAQLGFEVETTKNTRAVPTNFIDFLSESLSYEIDRIQSNGLRNRRLSHRWGQGNRLVTGSVDFELTAETVGAWLQACIDGVPATTGAGPYVHTYSPDTLKSLTIQIGKPDTGNVVRVFEYTGMMVQSWSMAIRPNEFVTMSTDFRGHNETVNQTLATASYSTFTGFTFAHASLTIAGVEYCVDSLDINGTNNLDVTNKICSTNPGAPTIREAGMWEYGGNFEMDFENLDLYNLYRNATEGALVVTLNAGASAQLVQTMNVRLDGDTPSVSGPEILKQTIPFVATSATTDAAAYTAVLTNSDVLP